MNYKTLLKSSLPHIVAVLAMIVISSVYFAPAWEGESLRRDDKVKSVGGASDRHESLRYENKDALWNSSRFSGMPDFLTPTPPSSKKLKDFYNIPQKLGIPTEIAFLICYMLGFYILLVCYGVNPWLSIGASIAFGLTSYNLIIIEAGHFKKVRTIAFIAPTLAGVLLTLRGKYLYGFVLTAFFLSMQIAHEHIQMSYYLMLGLLCIGLAELYVNIKEKTIKRFSISVGVLLAALLIAIGPNFAKLYSTYKFNEHSIRGQKPLAIAENSTKAKAGLDKDYINAWSSGKVESMMLFAPNVKGGASAYVKSDKDLLRKVDKNQRNVVGNMNQYWGDQTSSGGPNHAGTVFVTLFIIGLFILKGPFKNGMFAASILLLFLSWGKHFSVFTDLFVNYFPLYNKFRAPVSILAVAIVFIIFFGIYALSKALKDPTLLEQKSKLKLGNKPLPKYLLGGLGFILFLALGIVFPKLFNSYFNAAEIDMFNGYRNQAGSAQIDAIMASLEELRIYVFRMEFLRSLFFAVATVLSIYLFKAGKLKNNVLIIAIGLLAIIDVWGVSQRYVSKDNFAPRKNLVNQEYQLSEIDNQIYAMEMQNNPDVKGKIAEAIAEFSPKNEFESENIKKYIIRKNTFYRVFNQTVSTFNDNKTSGSHRSIGGYSAAKLRRYQDLIEHSIARGNMQVLNMLNTKYIITNKGLQVNPNVNGAAWFVNEVEWAANRKDEMNKLNTIDTKTQAVINQADKTAVGVFESPSATDKIELDYYEPDYMVYRINTSGSRLAVFSEIYYPDWKVFIDGKEVDCFTADYVLRAVNVPAGEHKIEFKFEPDYYFSAAKTSMVFYYLLMAMVLAFIGYVIFLNFYKKETPVHD